MFNHFLLMGVMTALQVNAVPAAPGSRELPDPQRPAWMQTDAGLQVPVTLEAKGRPLNVVLSSLTRAGGPDIRAARDIREYRVAIYVNAQPLWKIMARLQEVFGHGKLPNRGYEWTRIVEAGKPPRYLLQRNARAVEEEAAQLDYPHATALRWLKNTRDYIRLDPTDRRKFLTDCPPLKYSAAKSLAFGNDTDRLVPRVIGALSDTQLETLAQTGHVDVPQFTLKPSSVDWLRQQIPSGSGGFPGADETILPSDAILNFETEDRDSFQGIYNVSLGFKTGFPNYYPNSYLMDTLGAFDSPEEQEPTKPDQGPGVKVDLMAREAVPPGTRPVMSLAVALSLLAREAKIPIYAETFVKTKHALSITQGKPEYLLSRICGEYGYRWRKVGGDYLVYDKMWAQDRAADVPQPLLDRWLLALQQQKGVFDPSDCTDMARNLTDKQLKKTALLFDRTGLQVAANLTALRLMATLGTGDLKLSFGSEGLVLSQLDDTQTRLVQQMLKKKQIDLPLQVVSERHSYPGQKAELFDISIRDQAGEVGLGRIYLGQKTNAPILIDFR